MDRICGTLPNPWGLFGELKGLFSTVNSLLSVFITRQLLVNTSFSRGVNLYPKEKSFLSLISYSCRESLDLSFALVTWKTVFFLGSKEGIRAGTPILFVKSDYKHVRGLQ